MKVLLVMPSLDNGYWKRLGKKVGPKSEPLNLLYLATFLNSHGHQTEVLDCETEGIGIEELEPKIRYEKYDVVGVAMLTAMFSQSAKVCTLVKSIDPSIKVIVGGTHANLRPRSIVEKVDAVDVVAVGEAELTFLEIMDAFTGKKALKDIKGIAYRDKKTKEIIITEERPKVQDLDFFPIPDRSLIKMHLYRPSVSYYRRLPAYTMITTRGCPYRCTFCATAQTGYRMHSVPRVIEEMQMLVDQYGAKEILIRDDTFTINRKRTWDLCEAIIAAGLHTRIQWDCITRVNLVDRELLTKMKEAGCWGIHFGVEGGTQKLIDAIKKDTTLEIIRNAFRLCREIGIETRGYFMVGLPGSTPEDDEATIAFAKDVDPDWAQFTITTPYPGTQLFGVAEELGTFHTDVDDWDKYLTWSGFGDSKLPWTAQGRSSDEVQAMQRRAHRAFYFRPKVILRKLTTVDNLPILQKYISGAVAIAKD